MDFVGASTAGPVFSSSRIIRWSDLGDDEKDKFARFFAENNVAFFKDVDGSHAANVRLYDSSVIDGANKFGKNKKDNKATPNAPSSGAGRIQPLAPGTAALFDYSEYRKFTSLIGGADTTRPKERPLAWLMRHIEEIYDSRYAKDTQELKEGDDGNAAENGADTPSSPFPTFVVEFFTKRYGLRSLIDQSCWDVLYNTHRLRKEHLEVEVFARFLEEMYDPDDLLFYLYVRSVVAKELNHNFRARWSEMGRTAAPNAGGAVASPSKGTDAASSTTVGLQLSFRDASLVSRVVFGSEADPLYKTFMTMIEKNMSGKKGVKSDGRRIDVAAFLHLAVVEYHETRPAEEGGGGGSNAASGADADRLFREAAAAYDDRVRSGAASSGLDGSNGSYVGGGGGGGLTASPRPSPALLEAIGAAMHSANEAYLDQTCGTATQGLPKEVQTQIRSEVSSQLESKVDNVLSAAITVSQSGASSGSSEIDALASGFGALVASSDGGSDEAVAAFCEAALSTSEVRKTVEPLVNLLVRYAASRLKEATGGK